jgi:type II restriction enzyme
MSQRMWGGHNRGTTLLLLPRMTTVARPSQLPDLISRYKADPESVYNTWFVGDEARMKAFRSIRRGVQNVAGGIAAGSFGNDFKGSPLEVVLTAITEQKQVFEGAAHPFYWKPKLRIPDIYENDQNKKIFGQFLGACLNAAREDQVLAEMSRLAAARIKGVGPAVASIVYFLHPTIVPPFNTAILNGFNALFGAKLKLGSWESYFELREAMLKANEQHRALLSKDLGAFAGLLFEIGSNRIVLAGNSDSVLQELREKAAKAARKRHEEALQDERQASEHTQVQHVLIRIGRALGYDVFVARNDRHRTCGDDQFATLTLAELPAIGLPADVRPTVELIDVLWFAKDSARPVCAFEVEQSTSIYSGILRMKDLAMSVPDQQCHFYLVAPESREREVVAQMLRPGLRGGEDLFRIGYLPSGELKDQCDAMCRYGADRSVLLKIARAHNLA